MTSSIRPTAAEAARDEAPAIDWIFEGPDPEVGIFGDLVIHPCADEVDDARITDVSSVTDPVTRVVTITTTFECPGCGETTDVTETEPGWMFDEPGREQS